MTDTNVFQLSQPGTFADPLTEVLRNGARDFVGAQHDRQLARLTRIGDALPHRHRGVQLSLEEACRRAWAYRIHRNPKMDSPRSRSVKIGIKCVEETSRQFCRSRRCLSPNPPMNLMLCACF